MVLFILVPFCGFPCRWIVVPNYRETTKKMWQDQWDLVCILFVLLLHSLLARNTDAHTGCTGCVRLSFESIWLVLRRHYVLPTIWLVNTIEYLCIVLNEPIFFVCFAFDHWNMFETVYATPFILCILGHFVHSMKMKMREICAQRVPFPIWFNSLHKQQYVDLLNKHITRIRHVSL